MRLRSILPAVLLVLVACGGDDDPEVATETTTTTTAVSEEAVLHVEPDGLLVGEESFPFGSKGPVVIDAVRDVLGKGEEGEEPDCPPGPATFAHFDAPESGLLLTLQEDALVGWTIDEGSELTTAAGIGIGSTRAEIEAAYGPVEVLTDSTLGIEVYIEDGISALLDASTPDGVVTALWAGASCIYR